MASTTPTDVQYRILRITADSPRLAELISKFRDTKLAALQTSPPEWIYQHASEAKHPLSVWESRFARQNTILICVATDDLELSTEDALAQGEWVGFAAIRGPLSYKDYYAVPEMEQPIPENPDAETRWHLYDLYTWPAHRRRGIAMKLIAASMATAGEITSTLKSDTEGLQRSRVRLFVRATNTALVDWYKRLGFQAAGKATLREGLEANGMAESIPSEDTMSLEDIKKRFDTRIGLSMERVVDVA